MSEQAKNVGMPTFLKWDAPAYVSRIIVVAQAFRPEVFSRGDLVEIGREDRTPQRGELQVGDQNVGIGENVGMPTLLEISNNKRKRYLELLSLALGKKPDAAVHQVCPRQGKGSPLEGVSYKNVGMPTFSFWNSRPEVRA
jgi:hypothetical protein